MMIHTIPVGVYMANCYIIEGEKELLVIDPGAKPNKLFDKIDALQKRVVGVILTHGHFDHIGGVDELVNRYQCPLYMHEADYEMAISPEKNYSLPNRQTKITKKPIFIHQGAYTIGEFDLHFYDAPGHSEGSIMIQYQHHLFTGDVLFKESIGRTDLYNSNNGAMKNTLAMIHTLSHDLIVYPGHGESTTIDHELRYNPFL